MGLFQGKNIDVKDDTDLTLLLQDTKETFRIAPPTKELGSPKLTLTSQNGHIGARQGVNRVTLEDARSDISANEAGLFALWRSQFASARGVSSPCLPSAAACCSANAAALKC